ncbi:MAG TPA: maleylpyruvate isomerase family mycothiol-dependent enzyme [Streptomyces sp.]|uniref:maleylpyruvate isomerase family mycothiol-dependent enzyme n=1 Tax=Streptomyces sp. TaxID=1931 RepID=UPI002C4D057B|nr:maleylpyruvate isomerase family mycothiol-dependent enzyme [Streptomyces sp.]HWU11102.1 maleylpyruvate isomerase family mycothiol-dependent enzyme [Streptomyces sp.]
MLSSTKLSYDRHCAEIVAQTGLLRSRIAGADLTLPVPSCPGWNIGQLLRHLGGTQRWAEEIVRTRAAQPPADDHFRDLSGYVDEDPDVLGPWLDEGAARLAETLSTAGPDTDVWTPVEGETTGFFARRFAHETVIHRADATLALGADFTVDEEVALDAIDEWMELGSLPQMLEIRPEMRALLGPGHTLYFQATDTAPETGAEWLVDLTGDSVAWRRARESAAVTVRGRLTCLLLTVYRRQAAPSEHVEVIGDEKLFALWLEQVGFG